MRRLYRGYIEVMRRLCEVMKRLYEVMKRRRLFRAHEEVMQRV